METIITDLKQRKYFYTDGEVRKSLTRREADKLLKQWVAEGKTIRYSHLLGGQVVHCYHL